MTLVYDGLQHLHLGFVDPADNKPYDFKFDNKDTDDLAMFLYPRACALVTARKLAMERMIFSEYTADKIKQYEYERQARQESNNGNTGNRITTDEGREIEGGFASLCRD